MTTDDRARRWALFESKLRERGLSKATIPKIKRGEPNVVSFAQSRLWFLEQLTPGSAAYNDHYALRVRGPLDVPLLRRVLDEIARRQESLRTTFAIGPTGDALQIVHDAGQVPLSRSARTSASGTVESWIVEEAAAEAKTPFDLTAGPLARARLLEVGPGEWVLLFTIHHIVSDGWSMGVLAREITTLYGALSSGRPSPLPELETQYADYASWQREALRGDALAAKVSFWKGELEGAPGSIDLPADRPRPPVQTFAGATLRRPLGKDLSRGIDACAQGLAATPFVVLLAAFDVLLARYSGQRDLVVVTPVANRPRVELEGLIGCFVNTLAVRADLSGEPTLASLAQQLRDRMARAQAHQDLPFETVVEVLAVERDMSRSPIAQVMFVLQNTPPAVLEIAGLTFAPLEVDAGFAKLDLTLDVTATAGGYLASWEYNTSLFDEATVRRMVEHYEHLLGQMVANPQAPVLRLELLRPEERRLLLEGWNDTAADYPRDQTMHGLFALQARRSPGATALVVGTTRITYAELAARARGIARMLRADGVGPGDAVAVFLRRGEHLIPSLLGVLMAGAMYVPLDPAYPTERLGYILADANATRVLTTADCRAQVPAPFAGRCIDVAAIAPLAPPTERGAGEGDAGDSDVASGDRAYLIYTSGSTGQPKGVEIAHGNAVAFIAWAQTVFGPDELRGVLASTSICFDLSIFEIFVTLASGGSVILADNALALPELPASGEVSLVNTVPSAAAELLRGGGIPSSVRTINLAGEPLPEPLVVGLYGLPQVARVYNLYGPSETTTYSTYVLTTRGAWKPTVGRPIANTRAYVLDAHLQPVPLGVRGELYLGGAGVARGYFNRDDLTAARFVSDPFARSAGARMYRTGDVVRWLPSGELEFLGRNDHQVKLRGFRIELGEIELALQRLPAVEDAIALVREDVPGSRRLVGYVVPARGASLAARDLREALARGLPEYMVPGDLVVLEKMPLSPNGKVDRKRLPAPHREQGAEHVAPRNPVEGALARVWQDLLRVERVGAHDSFFDLGGDSILAMRMSALARREGLQITVRQLFELRTLERLAERAVASAPDCAGDDLPTGPFDLAPIQRWFFDRRLEAPDHYNQSVLIELLPGTRMEPLRGAVAWTLARHPALRLVFERGEGGWRQRFGPSARVEVRTVDVSAHAPAARAAAIDALTHELEAALDLAKVPSSGRSNGTVGHVVLFDAGEREPGALFLVLHHLVVDVVSWHVLLGDIAGVYARTIEGRDAAPPPPTASYARYVERLARYADTPAVMAAMDEWTRTLRPSPGLPRDVEGGANVTRSRETIDWSLGVEATALLGARAREAYGMGVDEVVLGALALAVAAWTGAPTLTLDVERHGRDLPFPDVDLTDTVGWFTALFPVSLELPADPRAALIGAKEAVRGVIGGGLPFGVFRYSREGEVHDRLERLGAREIVFNFLGTVTDGIGASPLFGRMREQSLATNHGPANARSHLLEVTGSIRNGALKVEMAFSRNVHARATMERLLERFGRELTSLLDHLRGEASGAYTPADFPLARLRQAELDAHRAWRGRIEDVYALTPAQHAILVDVLRDPRAGYYLPQLHFVVRALDRGMLEESLRCVIARHPALRTGLVWRGLERPVQVVSSRVETPASHDDWRALDEPSRRQRLAAYLADDRARGFALEEAPLLRLLHARWNDDEDVLVWTVHHAISDGWSLPRILGEVLSSYAALRRGEQPAVERPPPFRDYVAWLARQDDARGAAYWEQKLRGASPTDLGIPEDPSYRAVVERRAELGPEKARALEGLARGHGVTAGTVLQAAWAVVLARYSGRGDVIFGSVDSGRPVDLEGAGETVGMFVTTLPLRTVVDDARPIASLLADVQRATLEIREHAHVPLARIARAAGAQTLFHSICVIENYPALTEGAGAALGVRDVGSAETTRFPLTVSAVPRDAITLDVSASLLDPGAAAELLDAWRSVIEQMARRPDARVGDLVLPQAAKRREAARYWRAELDGAPVNLLPIDRPRLAQAFDPAAVRSTVPSGLGEALSRALDDLAQGLGTTPSTVLLGAFMVFVSRYAAQTDVVLRVDIGGQGAPVRLDVGGDLTFAALTGELEARLRGAREHEGDRSIERLAGVLSGPDAPHANPWEIGFAFRDPADRRSGPGPLARELTLHVEGSPTGYATSWDYDARLFDAATITRMADHFAHLAGGLTRRPPVPVWQVALAPSPGPVGHVGSPGTQTVLSYFEQRVHETPDAVALAATDAQLTYAELDARSRAGARHLAALGVARGDLVALHLERSPLLIVAILAALKAGAAYVPIDVGTPADAVTFVLDDCGAKVVVSVDASLPVGARTLVHGRDLDALEENGQAPARVAVGPGDLAYVIYTSGSTGRPKGVAVEHGALANYIAFFARVTGVGASDRVLQFASPSFDVSLEEIFGALCHGAALVLRSDELEPKALLSSAQARGVSMLGLPTAYWNEVVRALIAGAAFPATVRLVVVGGERLSRDVLAAWWREAPSRVRLLNMYGPTETTVSSTYADVSVADRADAAGLAGAPGPGEPPIGRPVDNAIAMVADSHGQPVPVGVPGELLVGGACLARGYLHRPELTAEKFTSNPFVAGRVYHTGDRVRWRDDLQLEYLGRIDHQVKVRGFRIEPGEIEAVLRGHAGVDDAVVVLLEGGSSNARLVAYVAGTATVAELEEQVRGLRSYMRPTAFVVLDRLPLTRNGKVDRRALPAPPAPGAPGDGRDKGALAPRTPLESTLASIWRDVLRLERVGVKDNFFALGGHSLLAIQVVSRIAGALERDVSVREVFEAPTIEALAQRLGGRALASGAAKIVRRGLRSAPLSFAQARLWFLDQLEPGSTAYNMPAALRVSGKLDVDSLKRALDEVCRRHEVLRTVFAAGDGAHPVQVVGEATGLPLERLDPPRGSDHEAWVLEQLRADAATPFDLSAGPPLRARLLGLADDRHVLLFNMHHIVSDGRSVDVFVHELATLYDAFAAGRPSPLVELAVQYTDYAIWQRERLTPEELERQLAFWRAQLDGAPPYLELPGKPRPAMPTYAGASLRSILEPPLRVRVETLAIELGATPFMVLLAALSVLLSRLSGQADLVVGVPIANRRQVEIEESIGLFVNTLGIRADLRGAPTFDGLVAQIKERLLGAQAHHDLPFEKLVDALQLERDMARTPVFQVMFAMQDAPARPLALDGLALSPLGLPSTVAKFDLTLDVEPTADGYAASWEYRRDAFDEGFIARMTRQFDRLVRAIVERPHEPCWRLPMLSEAERHAALIGSGGTKRDYPDRLVHELIEAQATRTPDAPAVADERTSLTYGELGRRARRVASRLMDAGVVDEARIAVALHRSVDLVVALLGILEAGAAYVPVDLTQPENRVRDILEDAGVVMVLTERPLVDRLPLRHGLVVVCIDEAVALADAGGVAEAGPVADPPVDDEGVDPRRPRRSPESLAYVLFTSGSTGRPKGVEISHRSLVNFLWSMRHEPGIEPADVALAITNLTFDIAGLEIYLPLVLGASVFVASREVAAEGRRLAQAVEDRGVTLLQATPSTYTMLLASGWQGSSRLKLLIGGEAVAPDLAQRLLPRCGSLWNVYGPTETTIWSTCARLTTADVTIGRPIANTLAYVLDPHMQPLPAGVLGELYLGGDGLARGYANRPDLTAERFLPNPHGPGRIYRTGDVARLRDDGVLECLGRADHQIKIRGHRIELGEIEAAIRKDPSVIDVVVRDHEDGPGSRSLAAYVVPPAADAGATLRDSLGRWLPDYMIPAHFVFLERLPLTTSGKIDRKALPAPSRVSRQGFVAPRGDVEHAVAAIFASVLRLDRVGVFDNFFERGGHSLLGAELVSRLRAEFGVSVALKALFESPTVAALSLALARPRQDPSPHDVVVVRKGAGAPWVCFPAVAGTAAPYVSSAGRGDGPSILALQAVGLGGQPPLASVEAIAAAFATTIAAVVPEGPLRLLGWSFGAVTAFACAGLLAARGRTVEELVMLDPPSPGPAVPEPLPAAFLIDAAASMGKEADLLPHVDRFVGATAGDMWAFARELGRELGIFPGVESSDIDRRFSLYAANMRALARYAPSGSFEGKAVVLGASEGNGSEISSWRPFLPAAASSIVEATHYSILQRLPDLLR
jgi:amino acid adenylation domain-containing protein/non-ribosomal peptide synthase protein (TIGR01720 family)